MAPAKTHRFWRSRGEARFSSSLTVQESYSFQQLPVFEEQRKTFCGLRTGTQAMASLAGRPNY